MLSSRGILTPDRMQAAEGGLRRAIELNPQFAPAYATLSTFLAVRGENLEEAFTLARKAAELEPGVLTHHLAIAQVLLRMDRTEEARRIALQVQQAAANDMERFLAKNLLESIETRAAFAEERKRVQEERARYEERIRQQAQEPEKEGASPREPREVNTTLPAPPASKDASQRGPRIPGEGQVVSVTCNNYAMDITLELLGDRFTLHTGNYLEVEYLTLRWKPPANFTPCHHLKGRYVKVEYWVAVGKPYAGEIASVEVVR